MSTKDRLELLQGTLDLLILRTLESGPAHGHAIAKAIEQTSADVLRVEQGSLYPALERLQARGWVTSKWGESPTGRRARYYTITALGQRQLGEQEASFAELLDAIARVMRPA
jgi:transcriptional regulator